MIIINIYCWYFILLLHLILCINIIAKIIAHWLADAFKERLKMKEKAENTYPVTAGHKNIFQPVSIHGQ